MEDLRLLWITVPIYAVVLIGVLTARHPDEPRAELARAEFPGFPTWSLPELPTLAPLDERPEGEDRVLTHVDLEGEWIVHWQRYEGERCVASVRGRAVSRFAHGQRWFVTRFTWERPAEDLPSWSAVGFDRARGDYVSVRIDGEQGVPVIGRGRVREGRLTTLTGADVLVPGFERTRFTQRGSRDLQRIETLARGTDPQGFRLVWRIDYRKP